MLCITNEFASNFSYKTPVRFILSYLVTVKVFCFCFLFVFWFLVIITKSIQLLSYNFYLQIQLNILNIFEYELNRSKKKKSGELLTQCFNPLKSADSGVISFRSNVGDIKR